MHYSLCPVCGSSHISKILSAIDHTVSLEEFEIYHCANCSLRFTQDVPDVASIGTYYKSENYISHTNTSKGLINRIYRIVRSNALRQKRKLIERSTGLRKGKILDVGSGTGSFASEMKKAGWEVTALEPDEEARNRALRIHSIELKESAQLFSLPANSYDAITLWHVLEHVHDLHGYVKKFRELLKESGKLIIAVPNYTGFDAEVYRQYWAAYDVPRHLYHFSPTAMERLMGMNSLSITGVRPMWYDSFYVSLLSSKYKKGRTNWLSALWTGLLSNIKVLENKKRCSSLIYIIKKKAIS